MPDLITSIDFLANIPLYDTEKPYAVLVSVHDHENTVTNNLVFEKHDGIKVTDIRGREDEFTLEKAGFQVIPYKSSIVSLETNEELHEYQRETATYLKNFFKAEFVHTWDVKRRLNMDMGGVIRNLRDWTFVDRPAKGAHNDVTYDSGPQIINFHLTNELKKLYMKPGFRFRIVNTWRSMLPVMEDNPLAVCDFRSVREEDFVPADRVIPTRSGEIYYLKYNAGQRWCWLENMTSEEPLLFVLYDSMEGPQARYCPHISIHNPRANPKAEKRRSIETRSIIISKITE